MTGMQQLLGQAMALHQAGRLAEAEPLYAKALRRDPRNYPALHFMGLLRQQQGRAHEALRLMEAALDIRPDAPETLHNYAILLHAGGRPLEALTALERALEAQPDNSLAWHDRGIVLNRLGRPQDAIASYDRAIALNPHHADAHYNRAVALTDLNRREDALAGYDRAIVLNPDFAPAYNNRGSLLLALNRNEAALASYDKAIQLDPEYAQAHGNRAAILTSLGRHQDALESCSLAIGLDANMAAFHDSRGTALANLNRPREALDSYDKALALKPDFAGAYSNRGAALSALQRPLEALASFDKAIRIEPALAQAYNSRGSVLAELKRFDEAMASYDKAIALKPDYAEGHANKGLLLLLQQRFVEGWQFYQTYRKILQARDNASPPWSDWQREDDIAGKTLLVESADGFGDAIQFCRYVELAEAKGAKVILSLERRLMRLFRGLTPAVQLVDRKSPPPRFDKHISLFGIGQVFSPDICGFAANIPYLRAEPERVRKWQNIIGTEGFRIGICWRGSPADLNRSFAVGCLEPIANIAGLRLISLQKGFGVEELQSLPRGMIVESLGDGFDAGPDAFIDAAAVIENLDLVIAPDTAIAHLAGALGRPAWLALKYVADWRWFSDRSDSPWYPSMRLFRQQSYGDWVSVFGAMEAALVRGG